MIPEFTDEDRERGYRITKWHEHNNFECAQCQFATLWLERMQKHQLKGRHPWAYPSDKPVGLSEAPMEEKLEY